MAIKARVPFLLLSFLFLASLSVSSAWSSDSVSEKQENPFYFNSFKERYNSSMGYISLLQRFDQNNSILHGITNYRLLSFKAVPRTFVVPHITDADYIIYVMSGKLLFTLMYPDHTESYILQPMDVLILPAGALAYVANVDEKETFEVMHLVIPLNIPGQFSDVFPGAEKTPLAFYHGFSNQTLEAAFNSPIEEIYQALLGEKEEDLKPDVLMEIPEKKIQQLSHGANSSNQPNLPPSAPFNLGNHLIYSNDYGKVWEALPSQLPQIGEFGVAVTLTELNEGSLLLPHINSKGWLIAYVTKGDGVLEIAAPWRENEDSEHYGEIQAFSSQLSEGAAFAIPPGYPFSVKSSSNSTLGILGFVINAEKNKRIFAAGATNDVVNQIGHVAKPLIFTGTAKQVTQLLAKQKGSYIVSAQPQLKKPPLSSILGSAFA
ncbi:hypothetical protein L6164_012765 [Bauhinia variegata]|uniref:Uncharacterized protein n=1 Tax=Bauhinia variegata TaxID=167791 RepID=A0ACB9PGM5_BAUVA|nr:hypothetical protein L6164_012765 [Bauhinia variegata]